MPVEVLQDNNEQENPTPRIKPETISQNQRWILGAKAEHFDVQVVPLNDTTTFA
ncbi:MAG: hypothetical protein QNJ47_05410 [Nostocaceae cyanobacterium]|nr:hypothetical protein [Nostocaceae cyanobacterium]